MPSVWISRCPSGRQVATRGATVAANDAGAEASPFACHAVKPRASTPWADAPADCASTLNARRPDSISAGKSRQARLSIGSHAPPTVTSRRAAPCQALPCASWMRTTPGWCDSIRAATKLAGSIAATNAAYATIPTATSAGARI
jgi:hypothetical protein